MNSEEVKDSEVGNGFMKDSPLMQKSKDFALEVIKACKVLREAKCEGALVSQFLRSGTSIGANIREAQFAHGKVDFVSKLQIALKECSETEYWLELLYKTGYITEPEYKSLDSACAGIRVMLISSIKTAKESQ